MPPEETPAPDASQPALESPSPAVEAPAPAAEPATPPAEASPTTMVPEVSPAPIEAVPASEIAPAPAEDSSDVQPTIPTAQIPPNEPITQEPEPIEPAPESPSAAASAPTPIIQQTGILHSARDLLNKARISIQDRKRKKRDKIMQALNTKTKITNDEVEKLLHVSDATATRYLSALEKENKIKQVGKTGHGVVYSKI